MTITLHWWLVPVALTLTGIVLGKLFGRKAHDYDFVSPLVGLALVFGGILASIAFLVGRWTK